MIRINDKLWVRTMDIGEMRIESQPPVPDSFYAKYNIPIPDPPLPPKYWLKIHCGKETTYFSGTLEECHKESQRIQDEIQKDKP